HHPISSGRIRRTDAGSPGIDRHLAKTQEKTALAAKNTPVKKTLIAQQPQLARALVWLAAYPDRQGLSLRKAAASAGVSTATLRKAIEARATGSVAPEL